MRATVLCVAALAGAAIANAARGPQGSTPEVALIDLHDDGVCLRSSAFYDRTNGHSGILRAMAWWPCPSDSDGLLVIDHNRNGRVDGLHELVGAGAGPRNGLDHLAALDGIPDFDSARFLPVEERRRDRILDSSDGVFHKLIIWSDFNQDGVSQEPELRSVAYAGIRQIAVPGNQVNRWTQLFVRWKLTRRSPAIGQGQPAVVTIRVR